MANQYTLTNDFAAIAEESGTLYNKGDSAIELASTADTAKGAGIMLLTGERRTFNGTLYARSMDAAGLLNVADFNDGGEGGDSKELDSLFRQNSTAYAVGDIAFSASLPSGLVLKCTTGGTTAATEPTFSGAEAGDVITDGGVTWAITRVLTTRDAGRRTRKPFTLATLEKAVAANNYLDFGILPGDYFTGASGYTYIFAGANPLKGTYSYTIQNNHAGLIVQTHATSKWNETNDTTGGYVSSVLHSYLVNTVLPKVKTDLGGVGHLYAHQKLYSTSINPTGYNRFGTATGCSSNFAWSADQYISALTEMQVYGGTVWSSSGFDTGEADQQLEVFKRFKHTEIFGNEYPWLRDVASATGAALADGSGHATYHSASSAHFVAGLIAFH